MVALLIHKFSEGGPICLGVGNKESETLKSPESPSVLQEAVSVVKRQRHFIKTFLPSLSKDMFLGQMSVSQKLLTSRPPDC